MKEKSGADRIEPDKVLRLLQNARQDQLEAAELPDGSFTIRFIPEKPVRKEKGKWAKVAEEMAEENLLGDSRGERLRKAIREFRDNFQFRDIFSDSRNT